MGKMGDCGILGRAAPIPRQATGYVRVSTSEQAREGVSLEAQRTKIEGYCAANHVKLVGVFSDEGISGRKTANRPGLEDALRRVCELKGTLVVYSLSRLARSTSDALAMAGRLEKCGAQLVSLVEHVDTTTPTGRFFFTVMASLAALESEINGERVSTAMQHKKSKGEQWCHHAPFGFSWEGTLLVPYQPEQRVLETARRYRRRGKSYREIADKLTKLGFRTRGGSPFIHANVRRFLCRPDPTTAASEQTGSQHAHTTRP